MSGQRATDAEEPGAVSAPSYRELVRHREYLGLLASRGISLVGDQIARVALTVLVFNRTDSAFLAALAFGATVLPACLSPVVAGVADRLPRRQVLIGADLGRALLLALMTVPGMPWGGLVLFMSVVTLVEGPWRAARVPLMREVLVSDARFRAGTGLDELVEQPGQSLGYLVAGALVAVVGAHGALVLDSLSFLASALAVRALVSVRRAAVGDGRPRIRSGRHLAVGALRDARAGVRAAMAPGARRPLLLCWVAASAVIGPEALVAPWAKELGAGGVGIGLLLAAPFLGCFVALPAIGRVSTPTAERVMVPLVLLSLLPLVLCALGPSLPVALGLLVVSGAGTAFTVLTRTEFLRHVKDEVAGRAYAVAGGGLYAAQGVSVFLAGLLASWLGPGRGIAAVAAVGLAGVLVILVTPEPAQVERPEVDPVEDAAWTSASSYAVDARMLVE